MSIIPRKRAPGAQTGPCLCCLMLGRDKKGKGPQHAGDAGDLVAKSCSCDPMDRSPPGSSVPGIF